MSDKVKSYLNLQWIRKVLHGLDDLLHFFIALFLIIAAIMVLIKAVPGLFHANIPAIIHALNDILLALIIMELLWPVLKFLKREPFTLDPFLYVGIISSTRRILLIEAEHSLTSRITEGGMTTINWQVPIELGVNVAVILVLAIALRITHHSSIRKTVANHKEE